MWPTSVIPRAQPGLIPEYRPRSNTWGSPGIAKNREREGGGERQRERLCYLVLLDDESIIVLKLWQNAKQMLSSIFHQREQLDSFWLLQVSPLSLEAMPVPFIHPSCYANLPPHENDHMLPPLTSGYWLSPGPRGSLEVATSVKHKFKLVCSRGLQRLELLGSKQIIWHWKSKITSDNVECKRKFIPASWGTLSWDKGPVWI